MVLHCSYCIVLRFKSHIFKHTSCIFKTYQNATLSKCSLPSSAPQKHIRRLVPVGNCTKSFFPKKQVSFTRLYVNTFVTIDLEAANGTSYTGFMLTNSQNLKLTGAYKHLWVILKGLHTSQVSSMETDAPCCSSEEVDYITTGHHNISSKFGPLLTNHGQVPGAEIVLSTKHLLTINWKLRGSFWKDGCRNQQFWGWAFLLSVGHRMYP